MRKPVIAFFGYARADDTATRGAISALHALLRDRVVLRIPKRFELWKDTLDMHTGDLWEAKLEETIAASRFYVPVLTPGFFDSPWCRREATAFLDPTRARRVTTLPLYVVDDLDFDTPPKRKPDALRASLRAINYTDVRPHLNARWEGPASLNLIDALAKGIQLRFRALAAEDDAIEAVAPLLAAGDLAGAERELREHDLDGEADTCGALAQALAAGDVARARTAHVDARRGLLGEHWDAVEGRIAEAEARVEAARAEAARVRAERVEAARVEAARAAAARVETEKEAARVETARVEAARTEATRVAAARAEAREKAVQPGAIRHTALPDTAPLRLAFIPAGSFQMGSPAGIGDNDEHPRHEVRITRPFLAGVTPVTQAQWRVLAKAAGLPEAPSHFKGKEFPVDQVSWFDAVRWCNALSRAEQRPLAYTIGPGNLPEVTADHGVEGYRLPTEAEWEYLCRAGSEHRWSFGDDAARLTEYGWFGKNAEGSTHRVGEKRPNAWGLHDVHGNVGEWTTDDAFRTYERQPIDDPFLVSGRDDGRVLRGGRCLSSADRCRSAFRNAMPPQDCDNDVGFRIILPLPPDP